jgi:hypothetical protein
VQPKFTGPPQTMNSRTFGKYYVEYGLRGEVEHAILPTEREMSHMVGRKPNLFPVKQVPCVLRVMTSHPDQGHVPSRPDLHILRAYSDTGASAPPSLVHRYKPGTDGLNHQSFRQRKRYKAAIRADVNVITEKGPRIRGPAYWSPQTPRSTQPGLMKVGALET